MKKLIIPNDKKLLMQEIKKCAVVVYDISLDKNEIIEANLALKSEITFRIKNLLKLRIILKLFFIMIKNTTIIYYILVC